MGLDFLLQENLDSYYWAGFILADGYISKNYRLRIMLSNKDEIHLEKIAKKLNLKITYNKNSCSIQKMDTIILKNFVEKFGLILPKTYNSPKLKIYNDEKLLSLLIGFIDGDGNIQYQTNRHDVFLRIKNHNSWIEFLENYRKFCPSCKIKIENRGYALLCLSKMSEIIFLKNKSLEYRLPIMNRKWDKINTNFISKRDIGKTKEKQVIELYSKKIKQKEICKIVKLSSSRVSKIIKKEKMSEVLPL